MRLNVTLVIETENDEEGARVAQAMAVLAGGAVPEQPVAAAPAAVPEQPVAVAPAAADAPRRGRPRADKPADAVVEKPAEKTAEPVAETSAAAAEARPSTPAVDPVELRRQVGALGDKIVQRHGAPVMKTMKDFIASFKAADGAPAKYSTLRDDDLPALFAAFTVAAEKAPGTSPESLFA